MLRQWLTAFGRVLFRPSAQTFLKISQDAAGKMPGAVLWWVLLQILHSAVTLVVSGRINVPRLLYGVIVSPIQFLLFVFFIHLLYQRLFRHPRDCYEDLLYVTACILIASTILSMDTVSRMF